MNISLLVGLKNNLDYNKHFYTTTRTLYPEIEICFVSYGSTDGTHEWLDSLQDSNVKYFYANENRTFSETFNKAATLATKEYVAYLHNDIVLAPNFVENIEKHLHGNRVVAYTTIEPPIFAGHERPGKIIYDLGTSLESFKLDALYNYVAQRQLKDANKTEQGATFFMCMPKSKLVSIGGMDKLFSPMFCEDDDLLRRFALSGLELITSLDAICYHFVSKTSRFSEEYRATTQAIELRSNRNFLRKWGSFAAYDINRQPLVVPKYNIGLVVKNANLEAVRLLEPFCDRLYIEDEMGVLAAHYYDEEQKNTSYDLKKRVVSLEHSNALNYEDIIVEFNWNEMSSASFQLLQQLPKIVKDSGEIGKFGLDIFTVTIQSMNEYQNSLIQLPPLV